MSDLIQDFGGIPEEDTETIMKLHCKNHPYNAAKNNLCWYWQQKGKKTEQHQDIIPFSVSGISSLRYISHSRQWIKVNEVHVKPASITQTERFHTLPNRSHLLNVKCVKTKELN